MVVYEKGKGLVDDTKESITEIAKEAKSEADAALKAKR
jgi:hypothetical protein